MPKMEVRRYEADDGTEEIELKFEERVEEGSPFVTEVIGHPAADEWDVKEWEARDADAGGTRVVLRKKGAPAQN